MPLTRCATSGCSTSISAIISLTRFSMAVPVMKSSRFALSQSFLTLTLRRAPAFLM